MSKAFVKEDDDASAESLPDRAIPTEANLVTAEGLAQIDTTIDKLEQDHARATAAEDGLSIASVARDLRYWKTQRATAQLTPPGPTSNVQFGSRVTIVPRDGRRQAYRIVGIDEADPTQGRLSYLSPLAQAMINCEVGDTIDVGATQAEIIEIA